MDPIHEANGSPPDTDSAKWSLLSLLTGWVVGAFGFAVGVESGLLPTVRRVGVTELIVGAIVYGLLIGLTAGLVTQSAVRERKIPWVVLVALLVGMSVGAVIGYSIVQEFLGAVWAGLGGALAGGLMGTKVIERRRKRCT